MIERIDMQRRHIVAVTDHERLLIPFDYAAAGHLTHGYATTRARTAVDGELVSVSRFSKAKLVGEALALGLLSRAWSWWYLMRPDPRFASPSRRAWLAALRAPPRLVVPSSPPSFAGRL